MITVHINSYTDTQFLSGEAARRYSAAVDGRSCRCLHLRCSELLPVEKLRDLGLHECLHECPGLKTSAGEVTFKNQMKGAENRYRKKEFEGQKVIDMLKVTWSDELADTALRWVLDLCAQNKGSRGGHDKCRVSPSFDFVGQNLVWCAGSAWGYIDADIMAVKGWYDEKDSAPNDMMFPFGSECAVIGLYTQVLRPRS